MEIKLERKRAQDVPGYALAFAYQKVYLHKVRWYTYCDVYPADLA